MNFGVYIRSSGERTEQLCYESVVAEIDPKKVEILKGYSPSYQVYQEMFRRASKSEYDWYLGLDADIILKKGWHNNFSSTLGNYDTQDIFKFTFQSYDTILEDEVNRGIHLYNNLYSAKLLKLINRNALISKLPPYFHKFFHSAHYLKPESFLQDQMFSNYKLRFLPILKIIGTHGDEQYLADLYRRFTLRKNRNPEYINKYAFLQHGVTTKNDEQLVAQLAWHNKLSSFQPKMNTNIRDGLIKKLKQQGLAEKRPLKKTLQDYWKKYQSHPSFN